ncbi:MAG: hypothetical protein U0V70_15400 [Terriglobia bacterium]
MSDAVVGLLGSDWDQIQVSWTITHPAGCGREKEIILTQIPFGKGASS